MAKPTLLLVVDDAVADSDYILTLLHEVAPGKFDIVVCRNITDTLMTIGEREVEIITLDLFLPDSSGLGTLLAVRAKAPDVPVVIVSGLDDSKVTQEAMFYGAQAYLVKGEFDGPQLLDAMIKARVRQDNITLSAAVKRMQKDLERSRELNNSDSGADQP